MVRFAIGILIGVFGIWPVVGADQAASKSVDGWPGVPYSKVVAYSFENTTQREPFSLLQESGIREDKLQKCKKREVVLEASQVGRLLNATFASKKYVPPAACYNPHHIFVFYDNIAKPVAAIEICFECINLAAFPEKDTQYHHDFPALAILCSELGLGLGPSGDSLEDFLQLFEERNN